MAYSERNSLDKLLCLSVLLTTETVISGINFSGENTAFAQSNITPDNTLGNENSQVIKQYNGTATEAIKGGAVRGGNLFHSFLEFNVSEDRTALFLRPDAINTDIRNILVRVTGTNRSDILGNIDTTNLANANLFLINPNGIFFGAKASLNLSGSFVGTTASGINLSDGSVFSATSPQPIPILNISVPIGLQFGRNAGEINLQGTLQVPTRKTLALVGGNVNLNGGKLIATSGQIAVGGILEPGSINLDLDGRNQVLTFPDNKVALADISINNEALINTSSEPNDFGNSYIQLYGRRITVNNDSQIVSFNLSNTPDRGIFIQAEQLTLENGAQIGTAVGFTNKPPVTVTGGNVAIKATDFIKVIGTSPSDPKFPSALFAYTYSEGSSGDLTIETGKLIVEGGGNVATTAWEPSTGNGGTLKITATDFIQLSGNSPTLNENTSEQRPSGLFTQTLGGGNAGSLIIKTPALIAKDGGVVRTGTGENSRGKGGSLTINASNFIELSGTTSNGLDPSGLFSRSQGTGEAGSISITTGKLTVRDRATVTAETLVEGDAGTIDIKAREINLDNRANLKATTQSGNGGDINLQIENQLLLRRSSFISTTAGTTGGTGNGGNININIPNGFIIAVPGENSDITANAFQGKGGNVNINAFGIFGIEFRKKQNDSTNDITASSEFGLNGTVKINTPEVEPNQRLVNLSTQPVEPRLAQVCQAAFGRNRDSFTVTGRGGLPNSPNEVLSSDAVLSDWIAINNVEQTSNTTTNKISIPSETKIVEATGWVVNPQGEIVLTANTPITTPRNSWQTATACNESVKRG